MNHNYQKQSLLSEQGYNNLLNSTVSQIREYIKNKKLSDDQFQEFLRRVNLTEKDINEIESISSYKNATIQMCLKVRENALKQTQQTMNTQKEQVEEETNMQMIEENNIINIPLTLHSSNNAIETIIYQIYHVVNGYFPNGEDENISNIMLALYRRCSSIKYFGVPSVGAMIEMNVLFILTINHIFFENSSVLEKYFNVLKRCFWVIVDANARYFGFKESHLFEGLNTYDLNYLNRFTSSDNQVQAFSISGSVRASTLNDINTFLYNYSNGSFKHLLRRMHMQLSVYYYIENPNMSEENRNAVFTLLCVLIVYMNFESVPPLQSPTYKSLKICYWEAMNLINKWCTFEAQDKPNNHIFTENGETFNSRKVDEQSSQLRKEKQKALKAKNKRKMNKKQNETKPTKKTND